MLIRDAFGYALPGAVFLGIGVISGAFSMSRVSALLSPYTLPAWLAFFSAVVISYVVGDVLAAVAYSPFMVAKYFFWFWNRHWPLHASDRPYSWKTHPLRRFKELGISWLNDHPTEVCSSIVEIRSDQPKLVDTLDRRETLALMSGSITVALLAGWYVFYDARWTFSKMILWFGFFALLQFLTGMPHLRRVAKATEAYYFAQKEAPKPEPDLTQLLGTLIKSAKDVLDKINS